MPFIYGMFFVFVILDILLEIYHRVAFFFYRIPYLQRSDYIFIDRHRVSTITIFQKFNCVYCGYVNGVLAYARAIAAETERYWCPMKHEDKRAEIAQPQQKEFFERNVSFSK
jgi:hypothetical protein